MFTFKYTYTGILTCTILNYNSNEYCIKLSLKTGDFTFEN